MTRANGFWGLVVEPSKLYSQQVPASFKVTMASLGSNKELSDSPAIKAQRTSLIFNLDNKDDFTICSLSLEKVEQQPLDLVLSEGEVISFRVEGSHSVHLSGYYLNDEETDGFNDEDDEEMYSDEAEEDSQIEYDSEEDSDDSNSGGDVKEKKNPRIRVIGTDEEEEESEFDTEDTDEEDLSENDSDLSENDSDLSDENGSESEESEEEAQKTGKRSVKFDVAITKKSKENNTPAAIKVSPVTSKVGPAAIKVIPTAVKESLSAVSAKVTPSPAKPAPQVVIAKSTSSQAQTSSESIKVAAPVNKTLPSGLKIEDLKLGSGAKATQGKSVLISYKGTLLNGKVFDSNFGGKPLKFAVGKGNVIKGMDIGIVGMAVGGSRKLVIPAPLAYGKQAIPGIPSNSTLTFEIRLEKIL